MNTERKILIVINGDANNPIVYSETVSQSLETSISHAIRELELSMPEDDIKSAIDYLNSGNVYWWKETYCFTMT